MHRHTVPALLALALVWFLIDGAVHSVHHLDVGDAQTDCPVAAAAASISLVALDLADVHVIDLVVLARVTEPTPHAPGAPPAGIRRERAPPDLLA